MNLKPLMPLGMLAIGFQAISQIVVAPDFLSIGGVGAKNGQQVTIYQKNGAIWKNGNNWFLIDMTGSNPRIAGTNDYLELRSYRYSYQTGDYVPLFCKDIYFLSDERLKTDITDLSTSLGKLNSLSVMQKSEDMTTFMNARSADPMERKSIEEAPALRLSTESLAVAFPQLVETDSDGNSFVDYVGLIPVIIQALKEANEVVDQQETIINELKAKLAQKSNQ